MSETGIALATYTTETFSEKRGDGTMKIAMTVWGNRISPVFDSAQTILLADIKDKSITDIHHEFIPLTTPSTLARTLIDLEIDRLICGAISQRPAQIIERAGILLLPFISGNARHVLELYVREKPIDSYRMPGCYPTPCLKQNGRGLQRKERNG